MSQIWQFFDKIEVNKAKCMSCNEIYQCSSNTSNLRLHIKRKHCDKFNLMESGGGRVSTPAKQMTIDQCISNATLYQGNQTPHNSPTSFLTKFLFRTW